MIQRSENLRDWLRRNPGELPGDNVLYSTLLTFQAIFGDVWDAGDGNANDDGATTVDGQIGGCILSTASTKVSFAELACPDTAIKLRAALDVSTSTTPPIIELRCNSDWLEHVDGFQYKDKRKAERGGDVVRDMTFLGGVCREADQEQLVAFWSGDTVQPHNRAEVITFCPQASQNYGDLRLKAYKDQTYQTNSLHLDNFKADSIAFTLIHELTHSKALLGTAQYGDLLLLLPYG